MDSKCKEKSWLVIDDDFKGFDPNMFTIPEKYMDYVESVLIPEGLVSNRVDKVALQIHHHYSKVLEEGESLKLVGILKGGYKFFNVLADKLQALNAVLPVTVPLQMEFIKVKSYENDKSTGNVKITGTDNAKSWNEKHVMLVEDIIDTGHTMAELVKFLWKIEPKSLKVAAMTVKRTPKSNGFLPDFAGFEIPDKFVIGYALDYNEVFRDLQHVCIINQSGIEKFAI